mmetsp:Transcript_6830/g.7567  ORF Transcript_6830/g.7567 Transcript_6830/m.7567 type:complete len:97 (-) Transcript_6830:187-477(-)
MASRAIKLLTFLAICAIAYTYVYNFVELSDRDFFLLRVFPWWLLVTYGAYALGSVAWSAAGIKNCDVASEALAKEITAATEDLKSKGFVFKPAPKK